MLSDLEIRESVQADCIALEAMYPKAFPEEDLLPLVRDLLRDPSIAMSLVGVIDGLVVGHGLFTKCAVVESGVNASLLGPLAVTPEWQRRGIGSSIVREGLTRMEDAGVQLVCVLGDPAYYERFGFAAETSVEPPYRLPAEWRDAWQSQCLGDTVTQCHGRLSVPRQWARPALWAP